MFLKKDSGDGWTSSSMVATVFSIIATKDVQPSERTENQEQVRCYGFAPN